MNNYTIPNLEQNKRETREKMKEMKEKRDGMSSNEFVINLRVKLNRNL